MKASSGVSIAELKRSFLLNSRRTNGPAFYPMSPSCWSASNNSDKLYNRRRATSSKWVELPFSNLYLSSFSVNVLPQLRQLLSRHHHLPASNLPPSFHRTFDRVTMLSFLSCLRELHKERADYSSTLSLHPGCPILPQRQLCFLSSSHHRDFKLSSLHPHIDVKLLDFKPSSL